MGAFLLISIQLCDYSTMEEIMGTIRFISLKFKGPVKEPTIVIHSEISDEVAKEAVREEILEEKVALLLRLGPTGCVCVEQKKPGETIDFEYDESWWKGRNKYRLNKKFRDKFCAWLERL